MLTVLGIGGYMTYPVRTAALATRIHQAGVVAAAATVFARLGFADTRVEDILAEAGVARRTFYKHFTGKEDVLAAVYDLATSELVRGMREVESPDPLSAVRRGLDLFLDYHVENAPLLRVLVEQAILSDSPLAAARARFRDDLVHILDVAVRATTGEAHDPLIYRALLSALEGMSLELVAGDVSPTRVERTKRVMHLLLERVVGRKA